MVHTTNQQLLQKKFNDHRCFEELQNQNMKMKQQIEELRQKQGQEKEVMKGEEQVRPMMVHRSSNTEDLIMALSTSIVPVEPERPAPISSRLLLEGFFEVVGCGT